MIFQPIFLIDSSKWLRIKFSHWMSYLHLSLSLSKIKDYEFFFPLEMKFRVYFFLDSIAKKLIPESILKCRQGFILFENWIFHLRIAILEKNQ